MATSALKLVASETPSVSEQTEAFVRELTELSHKHRIGITGSPDLFLLDRDDFALAYDCDDKSKLILA